MKNLLIFLLIIIISCIISCSPFDIISQPLSQEQEMVILGPDRNLTKLWEEISKDFPNGPTKKIVNAFNINDSTKLYRRYFEQWIYENKNKDTVIVVSIVDGKIDNIITIPKAK